MNARWKIAALLAALVVVSAFAGYFAGFNVARAKYRARSNPDAWNVSVMRTLDRRLKLTDSQHTKVQDHVEAGVVELKGIRLSTIERSNEVIERIIASIERELTPEQIEEFAKLKKERAPTTLDVLKVEPRKP
jgi:hypothetical protein